VRVAVVGAGAVGSLLAGTLTMGGAEVALVRRSVESRGRERLRISGPGDGATPTEVELEVVPPAAALWPGPDVVLVTVKQPDVEAAVASLAGLPDAVVVTAENGVGAEETALRLRPDGRLLAASVTASVELRSDGEVAWLRRGGVSLAQVQGDVEGTGRELLAAFGAAGLDGRWFGDVRAMKWSKLLANLVANATSGLLDMDPVAIYADDRSLAVELAQLRETVAVMRAAGIRPVDLPGASAAWLARAVALPGPLSGLILRRIVGGARGGKDPSLRAAVREGGPTEVGWLNGAVARIGAGLGVGAPINEGLARLVDEAAADPARRAWFRGRPDRLAEALRRS
jgi:2-dehydropantoate 2-reductase